MQSLTAQLSESLGEDTASLALRVGIHSGSVTGGVLRGDKSRFQLFGDAMNTTSRMESNGEPGRIHISEATANLLKSAGKEKWFIQRPDKIVAKGKGEMTTFFVSIRSSSTATSSVTNSVSSDGDLDMTEKHEASLEC